MATGWRKLLRVCKVRNHSGWVCRQLGFTLAIMLFSFAAFANDWVYTTKPGDTLWNISRQYLQDETQWVRLKEYNKISNPRKMPPGKKLNIPYSWLRNKPKNAVLLSYSGEVDVNTEEGKQLAVKAGLSLALGTSLTTRDGSFAIIEFADGSTLYVRENTNLTLNKITYIEKSAIVDTQVRLQRGGVESKVIPFTRPENRFEIITPAAVAAVRGTVFQVSLDKNNSMQSEVIEGAVKVKNEFGEKLLPAGFGNIVQQGQPPGDPETLLPAPDLSTLQKVILQSELSYRWPPLDGAEQYRVIMLKADKPVKVLLDQHAFAPVFKWMAPEKGRYEIQVRGIAKSGLQGLPSSHQFNFGLINTDELERTRLNTPENGDTTPSNVPTLHWYNVNGADAYRIQISDSESFSTILYDSLVKSQFFSIKNQLTNGSYFWRVAGVKNNAKQGPFSQPFHFTVRHLDASE